MITTLRSPQRVCEKAMALDDNAQEAKERLDQNYYSTKKKVITKTQMVLRKMGPHPEDWPGKTDLQIIEEVLKEQSSSRSTFLVSMGVLSMNKRSVVSAARIRELEEKLSGQSNNRYMQLKDSARDGQKDARPGT
ncbi:hypothetical protein BRADI_1g44410v3 [Brachypodium distachyon]|uniref:Uncharacterized protein n=1 Tax=Brachypodium distachyon TaxID=15368 RepID=A0A0Q3NMM2_BRADI|nr:hypothetical protein BRADI_1g44410v3 [Brachypodium distachyon]